MIRKFESKVEIPVFYAIGQALQKQSYLTNSDVKSLASGNDSAFIKVKTLMKENISIKVFVLLVLGMYNVILIKGFSFLLEKRLAGVANKISEKINPKISNIKNKTIHSFLKFLFNPETKYFEHLLPESAYVLVLESSRFAFAKFGLSKYYEIVCSFKSFMNISKIVKQITNFDLSENDAKKIQALDLIQNFLKSINLTGGKVSKDQIEKIMKQTSDVFENLYNATKKICETSEDSKLDADLVKTQLMNAVKDDEANIMGRFMTGKILKIVVIIAKRFTSIISSYLHTKNKQTLALIFSWMTTAIGIAFVQYSKKTFHTDA